MELVLRAEVTDVDGLACGHGHDHRYGQRFHAQDDSRRENAATSNVTDLRVARRRARSIFREIEDEVVAYLATRQIDLVNADEATERRVNEQITRIVSRELRDGLLDWLQERRKQTWGRAVRAVIDQIQTVFPGADERQLRGTAPFDTDDRTLNNRLRQIDAGLLTKLSEDTGDRITRQIRLGHSQAETNEEIGERIAMILNEGDHDDRQEKGVTGQTAQTKGELIAHDSIQDGYNTAATSRYLRNGFQFVVYDAVLDKKTTNLCRRLDGEIIDVTESPHLIPGNHPWCRSGVRPTLNEDDRSAVTDDDIADDFLQSIFQTASFRPTVIDPQEELQRTPLT